MICFDMLMLNPACGSNSGCCPRFYPKPDVRRGPSRAKKIAGLTPDGVLPKAIPAPAGLFPGPKRVVFITGRRHNAAMRRSNNTACSLLPRFNSYIMRLQLLLTWPCFPDGRLVARNLDTTQVSRPLFPTCCVARRSQSPAMLPSRALPVEKITSRNYGAT